jgi:platelet-activating factor acetylhydrolase
MTGSYLPRHLHWTSIPAHKNATLLQPPADRPRSRWPTAIFSHGLGGNRNAYSYLAGSLASYGVVVICPEHRDGSAALTLIRDPQSQNHKRTRRVVPYVRLPHTQVREIWDARNNQLRIRLWELGLIFEALTAIDRGDGPTIASNLNHSTPQAALAQFTNALDILEPGKVIFSGHSFGAVTAVQLLKSTYADHPAGHEMMPHPLFTPSKTAAIARQITPANPTILLDMWCFPLLAASTAPLYNLPLPCYAPGGPGGSALLAVESNTFFSWTEHLHAKARILSPDPTARTVTAELFQRPSSGSPNPATKTEGGDDTDDGSETETDTKAGHSEISRPNFFYVSSAAHLSQSDFAILFPRLTKRVFKSDRPDRVLRLNVRAQLQFLRENGVVVAGTASGDLVDDCGHGQGHGYPKGTHHHDPKGEWVAEDGTILQREKGVVEGWEWIDVVGLGGDKVYPSELDILARGKGEQEARVEEGEREMQEEMETVIEGVAEGVAEGGLKEVVVGKTE